MSAYYRVEMTLTSPGGVTQSWTVTKGDGPTTVEELLAYLATRNPLPLAPLSLGWSIPEESGRWPVQPEPLTASVLFLVSEASDLTSADVESVLAVDVFVHAAAAEPAVSFAGRVTEMQATPHTYGMVVSLYARDFTGDLADVTTSKVAQPAESAVARFERYAADIEAYYAAVEGGSPVVDPAWPISPAPTVVARDAEPEPASDAVRRLLDGVVGSTVAGSTARAILSPAVLPGGQLDPAGLFVLDAVSEYGPTPATWLELGPTAGGVGIISPAVNPASGFLSANLVDIAARWSRTRFSAVTGAEVEWTEGEEKRSTQYGDRGAVAVARVQTDLTSDADAENVGRFYVQASAQRGGWVGDTFRYYLGEESTSALATIGPGWFPIHDTTVAPEGDEDRTLAYRRAVLIVDLPADRSPNPGGFYAGRPSEVEFTIEPLGRYFVDFALRRGAGRVRAVASGEPYLSAANLAASATYGPTTPAQLDPAFAVIDFRLVGAPDA